MLNFQIQRRLKMNRLLYMVPLLFLLIGCTSKNEKTLLHDFKKKQQYHQNLLKTEKLEINSTNSSKIILTATYLSDPSKKKGDESFIIGLYSENGLDDQNNTVSLTKYFTITLNGKKVKNLKELSKIDKRLKNLSFISDWTAVYLVQFPHIYSKKMILNFNGKNSKRGKLVFYKIPRYLLIKKTIF